jgi:hypothetical protein
MAWQLRRMALDLLSVQMEAPDGVACYILGGAQCL